MSESAPRKSKAAPPAEKEAGLVWTPEMVKDLEGFIESLADKYVGYRKTEAEFDQRRAEATARHSRRVTMIMLGFLAVVVLFMGALTALGRVSGDALLFLAGTITGYVFSFVQKLLFPPVQPPPEAPAEV